MYAFKAIFTPRFKDACGNLERQDLLFAAHERDKGWDQMVWLETEEKRNIETEGKTKVYFLYTCPIPSSDGIKTNRQMNKHHFLL